MGARMMKYYDFAAAKGGFLLQMKLAMETMMAAPKAAMEPDTQENLERFHGALVKLLGPEHDVPRY